jgi:hypothetical protein
VVEVFHAQNLSPDGEVRELVARTEEVAIGTHVEGYGEALGSFKQRLLQAPLARFERDESFGFEALHARSEDSR